MLRLPDKRNDRMPERRSSHHEADILWHDTPLEETGQKEGTGLLTGRRRDPGGEEQMTETLQDIVTPEGTHQLDRGLGLSSQRVRQENRRGEG